jgi:hypothetical protein
MTRIRQVNSHPTSIYWQCKQCLETRNMIVIFLLILKHTPDHQGAEVVSGQIVMRAMPEVTLGGQSRKFVVETRALGARRKL